MALILREMTTRYGRSPGGYLWAIIEPIGAIAVLSVGFSLMMRKPALGDSFVVFYASGFLAFNHYQSLERAVNSAITFSRGLLRYPVVTWIDAIAARFILNFLTNVLNTSIIMWGAIAISVGPMLIDLAPVVEAMLLGAVLALGIGVLNAYLKGMYPVWVTIYNIFTRPLFLASGVIFIYEDLPEGVASILWYNPLIHISGLMRAGIFATYDPHYVSVPYVLGIAMVSMTVGLIFLRARARDIINDT